MGKKILSEEQKNRILDMVLNTRLSYKRIADLNDTYLEQVNNVVQEYCDKNNYKVIKRSINGAKFVERDTTENMRLLRAREIENWVNENERKPRIKIDGVKAAKEGEEETPEQKEKRFAAIYKGLKKYILSKCYESLEEIEDEDDREILMIISRIENKYKKVTHKNKKEIYDTLLVDEEDLIKAIFNLVKTKKATVEQIRIIADYYGVDLEETEFNIGEQEDSLEER